ncbi:MAG: hypothetical protein KKD94_00845 [Nanoarchaeota archaeon]|nr:hypothetical protein [Nanoarchaeota archaeon]MBU1988011.1 hypothetical protein [Nanoarchaeota archaeon]
MGIIKIQAYECERCSHIWPSRKKQIPIVCPKCKSPYWNIKKKGGKNAKK